MAYVLPLIGEARERHRRRRRRTLLALAMLAAGVGVSGYMLRLRGTVPVGPPGLGAPPGSVVQAPSRVFAQSPYMGVRCSIPNSIACDRVGLAVWLRRPADAAWATIDGRRLEMNRRGDELVTGFHRPRTEFDGYLRPAGIVSRMHVVPSAPGMWDGDPMPPEELVWLLVDYGGGRHVVTHLRVPLGAGWG